MLAIINPFAVGIHHILVHSCGTGNATSKKAEVLCLGFYIKR